MSETAFKIVNQKQFTARMKKKASKLGKRGGTGGPYHMAVIYLDRWIQKNFDHDGKDAMPETGGWKKLAPATIRARRWGKKALIGGTKSAVGRHKGMPAMPKILRNVGTLKKSWRHDYNNRRAIIENYATAKGSTYYYGYAHDKGKGRLPERRILPKTKQVSKKIKEIFAFHIRTSMK
jgi:phage gpG-like protein